MSESQLTHSPQDIWTKAAVLGGLWASFEIVVGSFLHNIHLPFSGSFLTFFATIFLIAYYQVWPEKGLIWRAGLICALMKSVSPSAVILGPMTGILTEALLVELTLRLLGNNPAGILLAGILSQLSALIHKVVALLMRYGSDIVRVYENMFEFAVGQFNNLNITPAQALLILVLIYTGMGSLASLIGYRLGKTDTGKRTGGDIKAGGLNADTGWDVISPGQRFHIAFLWLHILALPILIITLNRLGIQPISLVLCSFYILFCLIKYKRIKYRLLKPVLLIHLLLIGFLAGLFWESPQAAFASASAEGWVIGFSLILRAILVVTGFSALSTELRNPRLKSFLFRIGFRKVYDAVSMAFSALPMMMDRGISGKAFLRNPFRAMRNTILDADRWLYVFQQKKQDNI